MPINFDFFKSTQLWSFSLCSRQRRGHFLQNFFWLGSFDNSKWSFGKLYRWTCKLNESSRLLILHPWRLIFLFKPVKKFSIDFLPSINGLLTRNRFGVELSNRRLWNTTWITDAYFFTQNLYHFILCLSLGTVDSWWQQSQLMLIELWQNIFTGKLLTAAFRLA